MSKTMLCLVGEQPVPNILPIRHCRPKEVVLVHTHTTKRVSDNLAPLLRTDSRVVPFEITAYDILKVRNSLERLIESHHWKADDLIFNLTGGTKPMAWAAFQLAQELNAEFVYLQSEGGKSLLYFYRFVDGELALEKKEIISAQLTIDDYLRAHGLTKYRLNKRKQWFEELITQTLQPVVSEIISNVKLWTLEIDHVVRCETQFGIIEAKSGEGDKRKEAIDQLSTASQREFLGTFVKRFLIQKLPLGVDNKRLADAHSIVEIVLPSADEKAGLLEEDKRLLIETVTKTLGGKR
jgi:hypothetical protein